ncbi:GNAT family N-acetyltransferase [Mesorhizobium neociceri]|uniref:GNAT family N-acetyltransferase n=1 Tax=Mesorhizobium neociceri TaxID=1307853 RepID=A0A838BF69_9HYPH|nr:GNAT family N-acetyltransferase [Mesorhizobium neociceri]MBA1145208.1 GNAT family N-acetyltransferase [Mesorhizobium neociceri]
MRLTTERLVLRPWQDKDRSPMASIYSDARVGRFYPKVRTAEEANIEIDLAIECARTNGFHFQAAELKGCGEFIGMIGLGVLSQSAQAVIPTHPRVEIGWVLAKEHWGKGFAPEGAQAWLGFAWSIGLPEVVGLTTKANVPSQRVMQKIGMSYDPLADYESPNLDEGHWLRPRVVYRKRNPTL